jgi:molecular chaperone IbpA
MRNSVQQTPSYPPYNIEKLEEDQYRITMAVAGFAESDLDVTLQNNTLVISGRSDQTEEENAEEGRFLYRGIARRAFERRFELAETVKVSGARMENGLLHVDLVREVPEAAKPRKIEIAGAGATGQGTTGKVIEGKKAA